MAQLKMKKRLRRVASALTFALTVLTLSAGAVHIVQAAGNNKTKVNVGVTELTEGNVAFEVPLYYVLCVTNRADGASEDVQPKETYSIVNKSPSKQAVAVTQVGVSGVTNGTWSLVAEQDLGNSATDKKIAIKLGGIALPAVAAGSTTEHKTATNASDNTFYSNGKYKRLEAYDAAAPAASTVNVPIDAKVFNAFKAKNVKAVAQFRLTYTVSPLDKNGNVLKAK